MIRSSRTQIICFAATMLGIVGTFNGLNAMGGGGLPDHLLCTKMQALYSLTLGLTGWCGGAVFNVIGARLSVFIGSVLYCFYVLTIIGLNFNDWNLLTVYSGGISVGVGAGLLWTAFGAFSISYPLDPLQGFIFIWTCLNLGTAALALIGTFVGNDGAGLSFGNYMILLTLMCLSGLFGLVSLTHQKNVIRSDGSRAAESKLAISVEQARSSSILTDLPVLLLLLPLALSPNAHYPFLFNGLNAQYFNVRSRSFNTAIYSVFRVPASAALLRFFRQTQTTMTGLYVTAFFCAASMLVAHVSIFNTFGNVGEPEGRRIDAFTDMYRSVLLMTCFISFALLDSLSQTLMYSVMGRLSEADPRKAAVYTGVYKGVQSIGLCIYWCLEWWLTVSQAEVDKYRRYRIHWLSLTVQWSIAIPLALLGLLMMHTSDVCGNCGSQSVNAELCAECKCHYQGRCQGNCDACKNDIAGLGNSEPAAVDSKK